MRLANKAISHAIAFTARITLISILKNGAFYRRSLSLVFTSSVVSVAPTYTTLEELDYSVILA